MDPDRIVPHYTLLRLSKVLCKHRGSQGSRNTGGVADSLCTGFFESSFVVTIVINIISMFFAVFEPFNAATDRSLAMIVVA